jgi:hypothetical protein
MQPGTSGTGRARRAPNFSACTIGIGELVTCPRVGASLLVNSHADGTHSIPFYEGVLSRVVHLTKLVALAEYRTLAVKAGAPATVGGLVLDGLAAVPHSAPGGEGPPSGRGTDLLSGPIRNRLPYTACVSRSCWTPSWYLPLSGLKEVA